MPRTRHSQTPEPQQMPLELFEENQRLRMELGRARETQLELRGLLEPLMATPWFPALMQRMVETPMGRRALVWIAGMPRLVAMASELEFAAPAAGEVVYLNHTQNTVMAPANGAFRPPLDVASFARFTPDGRLVVRIRDDELVLERAACLNDEPLRTGDPLLFDRPSRMAFERLEQADGEQYLLEEVGAFTREGVGGRREQLDELIAVLTASLLEPELAGSYRVGGRRAILLYGPPGCGKSLMARTAAAEIQRLSGKRCRFAVVRPGEFESPYVGEAEANIRSCFQRLREAAGEDMAVLFLDEIEAIGRVRGGLGGRHSDRFLAALLAEIDGFCQRGQVSILAATNRRDLLDPALASRLSDQQIPVGRPDLRGAREIFGIHLPESLLYCADGFASTTPHQATASHGSSAAASHGSSAAASHGSSAAENHESSATENYEPSATENHEPSATENHESSATANRQAAEVRDQVLDTAVSSLYAPNAGTEICQLGLRDGTNRTVYARELTSGRLIEQIALAVRQRAFRRHVRGEGAGVRAADASEAVDDALAQLSTTITVHNARAHLEDLPDDVDVVRVEPLRPRPERRHRYLHAS